MRIRPEGSDFALPDGRRVRARVFGAHLANDVALAIRACELWLGRPLESRELASLRSVGLPARVEPIGSGILDSAHTEESARALRKSLETLHPGIRFVTIVSIARDKDARAILCEIAPVTRRLILCEAEPLRSAPADELSRLARSCAFEDVQIVRDPLQALEVARSSLHPDERLLVTGSFYLAGALRSRLLASANLAG